MDDTDEDNEDFDDFDEDLDGKYYIKNKLD